MKFFVSWTLPQGTYNTAEAGPVLASLGKR